MTTSDSTPAEQFAEWVRRQDGRTGPVEIDSPDADDDGKPRPPQPDPNQGRQNERRPLSPAEAFAQWTRRHH